MSRNIRRLINSVEQPQTFSDGAPASSLQEGGTLVSLDKGRLAVRRKHKGIVFKSTMSRDGNEIIDKKLTTNELEYKRKFVDYRTFIHNFDDDLPASKIYMPWQGTGEQSTSSSPTTAYLTPFKMICEKLIVRFEASDLTVNITFGVERKDNGDNTADVVATYNYTSSFVNNTVAVINNSDWSASPVIPANGLASLTITAASTDLTDGDTYNFFVTSVWKTFIEI